MCGICGILYEDPAVSVDRARLIDMRDRMTHRGPDGAGLLVEPGVGLGHRRLSIVDVAGGHQPLSNEDGSLWIVFNGEIYNHESLRQRLVSKGHSFKTRSDTEAIVHLYEEYGPACVEHLNGMFTFAIWDKRARQLFIARDRMGVKPLYYWQAQGVFVFASEIKSLLAWDFVKASLRKESIPEYLVFRHLSGDRTFFENIRTLEPGHHVTLSASGMRMHRYWHLPFDREAGRANLDDRVEELDHLLQDSVRLRLMSEVPLGTYCSGGVDSSLVTAYTSRLTTTSLNTFSVGFEDPDFDESEQARLAARVCGTTHHPLTVTEQMFADTLPQAIWFHDQPLNHANSVPILLLSRLAKKSVTVMLSGEGSDELFGGYPRYRMLSARRALGGIPAGLASSARWLTRKLRTRRLEKLVGALSRPLEEMLVTNAAFVEEPVARGVCGLEREWAWPSRHARLAEARNHGADPFSWLFYLDLTQYLVSLLDRQDKMSMAAGIESRVPFLDYRVVQLALRTGDEQKVSLSASKIIVKKLAERYLPKGIIHQRKSGFGVPLAQWFRNRRGLGRYLDYLASSAFRQRSIWNVSAVDRCVDEHMAARKDHSELLWALLNLELWSATYLDRDGSGVLS
jgi:asparagine synthase (glutamine-hydrolysing)